MLAQLLLNGLATGCLFALSGAGFALVYYTTRVFHIAHGAIYVIAAYTCYGLLAFAHWPPAAAALGGVVAAALAGAGLEFGVYSRFERRGAPPSVTLLGSLGFYIVVVNLIALAFNNETKVLRATADTMLHAGTLVLGRMQVVQMGVAAVVLGSTTLLLKRTALGLEIRALRDDPTLTDLMGLRRARVRVMVLVLGSALAGLASVLTALDTGMDPQVGMSALLVAAVAAIMGGLGSFPGAVLAGVLLGLIQAVVIWRVDARWADTAVSSLLIVLMVLRPGGLFRIGRRSRVEENAWITSGT